MNKEPTIPYALNDNPSSWPQRIPLIIAGLVGFCIAMYLAFYQLHIASNVWDPFFRDGAEKVLTSKLSKKFPIPDASLGAFGYLCDLILGSIGKTDRWRSQPWIVLLLGIVVCLLALTSILLILAQFFLIHSFCTLCLVSATVSFIIVVLIRKEILATLKFLQMEKQKGVSLWKAVLEGEANI
jgi:uncharacterized membrane protein